MAHIIGFVQGGVLYAASGTTAAEALDELCNEYGEDMAVRYAEGLASESPRVVAPGVPDAVVPGGTPDSTLEGEVHQQGDSLARGDDPGPAEPPPAAQADDTPSAPCGICGGPVPPDWASVSKELHGDVRCLGCTA